MIDRFTDVVLECHNSDQRYKVFYKNLPDQELLVCDWLITCHVIGRLPDSDPDSWCFIWFKECSSTDIRIIRFTTNSDWIGECS